MQMTEGEFKRIVLYMKNHYGIELGRKQVIVSGRLDLYLENSNYSTYSQFMDAVEANPAGEQAQNLVNILTTNHTYFMREFEQLAFFRDVVLPELRQKEKVTKDLRIWSAASSSGEEAYTLAMILKDELGLEYNMWESTVLATDISVKVLQEAIQGIYTAEQVAALPPRWKYTYFDKISETQYRIHEEQRKHVLFRQFNLMDPMPFKRKMHVVFLRNVMIYFDENTKRDLIKRIYDEMEPGGYLFIGTTESIDRNAVNFQYVQPSIYRK